jgi:ABC-2 type transport system ATP-binding protein
MAERKQTLLAMTRLDKFRDRPMKQLSGGMKQKLGLVCTLIHQPQFIILDEPTTGVDPVSRRDFWAILAELLRSQGTTALVSTAYMDEASRFSRVALMFGGKTLAVGAPDELRQLARGVVVSVTGGDQVRTLDRIGESTRRSRPWARRCASSWTTRTRPAAAPRSSARWTASPRAARWT